MVGYGHICGNEALARTLLQPQDLYAVDFRGGPGTGERAVKDNFAITIRILKW